MTVINIRKVLMKILRNDLQFKYSSLGQNHGILINFSSSLKKFTFIFDGRFVRIIKNEDLATEGRSLGSLSFIVSGRVVYVIILSKKIRMSTELCMQIRCLDDNILLHPIRRNIHGVPTT